MKGRYERKFGLGVEVLGYHGNVIRRLRVGGKVKGI